MGLNKTVHILLLPRLRGLLQAPRSIPPQLTAIAGDFLLHSYFKLMSLCKKPRQLWGNPIMLRTLLQENYSAGTK